MRAFSDWAQHAVRQFAANDSGAVTVDWVVLTGALCGMTLAIFTILTDAIFEDSATVIGTQILASATNPTF